MQIPSEALKQKLYILIVNLHQFMKSSSVDYMGILDLSSFLVIIYVKERNGAVGAKTNEELEFLLDNLTKESYLELYEKNKIQELEFNAQYLRDSAGHAAPDESETAKKWENYMEQGHALVQKRYDLLESDKET